MSARIKKLENVEVQDKKYFGNNGPRTECYGLTLWHVFLADSCFATQSSRLRNSSVLCPKNDIDRTRMPYRY